MNMNVLKRDVLQESQNAQLINLSKENKQNSISNQSKRNEKKQKNGSIFAGNFNNMRQQDAIAMKQVEAQKKKMKTILDQFAKDRSIDDNITGRRQNQSKLADVAGTAQAEVGRIQNLRQQLKETFGINDDSEEQKNLDLLEKSMDVKQTLSEDEMEQLKNIGPLTDYQKVALEYDSMEEVWQQRVEDANQGIANEGQTIVAIKLELLKTHPMTDAQKEAAKIMEAANKEVIGMLLQQTKDNTDEEMDKNVEKAEKQNDSVSKNKDTDQRDENNNIEQLQQADTQKDRLLTDIKKLIKKENILEEDVKGLALDEQI